MSRKVLLVDPDLDALGALASALRSRGITVANAGEAGDAMERAYQFRPDVVLVAENVLRDGDLFGAFARDPELADIPLLALVDTFDETGLEPHEVARRDVDHVVARVASASPRESRPPSIQELRGTLDQVPLVDLLQILAMNRRTGVLALTLSTGAGEVRIAHGEIADAVFRRLEGEKALYRLLGEREGSFTFSPGEPSSPRRIRLPTSALLLEGMRRVDEVARRRNEIAPGGDAIFMEELPESTVPLVHDIELLLQIPRSIEEVLDEIAAPDLDILEQLARLTIAGRVRRLPLASLTTPLAPAEQLPVLRSLVTRLVRPGFTPPPRLVLAVPPKRVPALAHAVRRIGDAVAPNDPPPRVPLPRTVGTLKLGDGVDLAVIGLPVEERFSPVWALTLPGTAAVVRLGAAESPALERICEEIEVPLLDAEGLLGGVDVAVPAQVAALVRSVLEVAAGV